MSQFLHLLRHDWRILQRNKLIGISAAVTVIYMIVLKGISHFGIADKALVMIIFNDPALLGFLFVGVIVLFEKNENTLQTLAVMPLKESNYILSKTIVLSVISVACSFAMAFLASGTNFKMIHFFFGALLTTVLFSFLGFILVANVSTFNKFILKAVGFLIFLSIPFLGYFGVAPRACFLLIPTQPCIDLFRISFSGDVPISEVIYAYAVLMFWIVLGFILAMKLFKKNLRS